MKRVAWAKPIATVMGKKGDLPFMKPLDYLLGSFLAFFVLVFMTRKRCW